MIISKMSANSVDVIIGNWFVAVSTMKQGGLNLRKQGVRRIFVSLSNTRYCSVNKLEVHVFQFLFSRIRIVCTTATVVADGHLTRTPDTWFINAQTESLLNTFTVKVVKLFTQTLQQMSCQESRFLRICSRDAHCLQNFGTLFSCLKNLQS